MKQSVLVTGGAGYIGSHTCKALARNGFIPITYDNLSTGHASAVKWGPLETGDIGDAPRLHRTIMAHRPVAVIHFAAASYVGESVEDPLKYYRNNVTGTINLLSCMREHGIGEIVFSSTCATYGIPGEGPIGEDCNQNPINPYGASKLMIERILADLDAAHRFRSVALRYFNAAGADSDTEIGEDHNPETHLIPLALQAVTDRSSPLSVFGLDYPTPDGSAVRDYIHVEDLAETHVAALKYLCAGKPSVALNIGTGSGFSVLEVIAMVEQITQRKLSWQGAPRRDGDPPALVANPSKLKEILGVDPEQFSSLHDIVLSAWRWHCRKQPHVPMTAERQKAVMASGI